MPETPEVGADAGTAKNRSKAKPKRPEVWLNGDADKSPVLVSSDGVGGRAREFESRTHPKFDKTTYQREYMKRWRAKRKAAKDE